jgi:hypothetical protein
VTIVTAIPITARTDRIAARIASITLFKWLVYRCRLRC